MKGFIALLLLVIASCSTVTSQDNETICRSNLHIIADAEVKYYSLHGIYTPDITALGLDLVCPLTGQHYCMTVNTEETEFAVICPNGHGSIKSWIDF